jgi:hypothetical protein
MYTKYTEGSPTKTQKKHTLSRKNPANTKENKYINKPKTKPARHKKGYELKRRAEDVFLEVMSLLFWD